MEPVLFDISETARGIRRAFDRRAQALGATRAQWRVLARLARMGDDGARQVDLADVLDVEPISLCRMVDRLETAGLVERRRDETDRRVWRVHLTAKADPIIRQLRALGDAFEADLLNDIAPADLDAMRRVLVAIRINLDSAAVGGDRRTP